MAVAKIRMPEVVRTKGNMFQQRPPVSDGSNPIKAGHIVVVANGVLRTAIQSDTAVWGQTPDDAKAPTDKPPVAFFGENHYCFDLADAEIEINVTDDTGVVGAGGPALSTVVIGSLACLRMGVTAGFTDIQFADIKQPPVGSTVLRIIGIPEGQAMSDTNGRVRVKILPAALQ